MTPKTLRKQIWLAIAGMLLAALSLPARQQDQEPASTQLLASNATKPNIPASAAAEPSLADVMQILQQQAQELASLRVALKEQQELTARLEATLGSTTASAAPVAPDAAPAPATLPETLASAPQGDLTERLSKVEKDLATTQKSAEDRLRTFGPFAFSGDLRLRLEPTFGGPADQSLVQTRGRFRFRFNADTKVNDDFSGGFTLSSGNLNSPTSTNQTFDEFFMRKPIAIDRAELTYTPHYFKPLTISGGKFYPSWFSTELVWDKDLNPEGATESLAFAIPNSVFKNIKIVSFQLPFAQFKQTTPNKSTVASVLYGGQVQGTWQLNRRITFDAFATYYDYVHADSIANALVAPTANFSSTDNSSILQGLLPLNSNNNLNSIATVTSGGVITKALFASKFGIMDAIARLNIQTPADRWPVSLLGDLAQNTLACGNLSNLPVGAVLNRPCNSKARRAYWVEARVGRTERKGDWEFWYARFMVQQESVIGAFNYSEILPPNNSTQHRIQVDYQLFQSVGLTFNALIGRPLVTASSPLQPWSERLQFDVTYKF